MRDMVVGEIIVVMVTGWTMVVHDHRTSKAWIRVESTSTIYHGVTLYTSCSPFLS